LSHNNVWSIYEDKSATLWIGTWGEGLNKFDRQKEQFRHYKHDANDPNSLSNNYVFSIYEDRSATLWIGTRVGVNKFDRQKEQFSHYKHDANDPNSLSNNYVVSIYEDKSATLWIGTSGGLNKFDRQKEQFSNYREKDGLPNNVIYGILEDNIGNLWMSTNKGLSKFNLQTEEFRNYDVKDGLQSNEFNEAYFKSKSGVLPSGVSPSGKMFFGGINGFNAFFPDSIKDNPHIPPIVITDFQIFNKEAKLDKHISSVKKLELSYKDYVFSFEFAALNYTSPEKNQYAYQMQGFDEDWVYCGTRRYVSYTNLDPGDYIFRVKGSNNDRVWNEEGTSINLTIVPPFWQTWWFRVLAVFTVALLIVFIFSWRKYYKVC